MRSLFGPCLLLAGAVASFACDEDPTQLVTTAPSLDAASAPPASGPNVVRIPFEPGVLSGDANLAVAVGFEEPFADHCGDTGSPDQPGVDQIVFTPPGTVHIKSAGRGISVVVYEIDGALTGPACDLLGAPIVASGTANSNLTFSGGGPGADRVNVVINGVVDLTGGGQARLHATTQVLIKPDGSFAFDHTRIVLTPL